MKKLIFAFLVLFATPVAANEEVTAVEMAATYLVYTSECKPSEEVASAMANVTKLYMTAAGVNLKNDQFLAQVLIKAAEFKQLAKQNRNYCKSMEAAMKEAQQN